MLSQGKHDHEIEGFAGEDPRTRCLNSAPIRGQQRYVLYWMTSFRRLRSNFALERAIDHARRLQLPLVVFEPLNVGYPYANARLHTFVLEGMADNAARCQGLPIYYFPYVESAPGEGRGLLEALAAHAAIVVGDDWPSFFVPTMQRAVARRLAVRFEVVDSNGLFPMHATPRVFTTAHSFRVHLQKQLPLHLMQMPRENPFEGVKLPRLEQLPHLRWQPTSHSQLRQIQSLVQRLPIDQSVAPAPQIHGGTTVAEARLGHFVVERLGDYDSARDLPSVDGTSGLSPWLHFGHLSAHQAFAAVMRKEEWSIEKLGPSIGGARSGWWHCSAAAEAWLDQLVTWRELAFNMASHLPDRYQELESLPAWAQATMAKHARDARPYLYSLEQLERAQTHDEVWNAAMRQLRKDGWFHNAMRMLWGKRIYEWSPDAATALKSMDTLMSRYSLDGRDPVSWAGFFWVLGRYDRAWGPERPIFGSLRFLSSDRAKEKRDLTEYLERYGA